MAEWYARQCQINEIRPDVFFLKQLQAEEKNLTIRGISGNELALVFETLSRISFISLTLEQVEIDANMFRVCFERENACLALKIVGCNLQLPPQRLTEIFGCLPSALEELSISGQCTDNLLTALIRSAPTSLRAIAIEGGQFGYRAIKALSVFCVAHAPVALGLTRCGLTVQSALELLGAERDTPGTFSGIYLDGNNLPAEVLVQCDHVAEQYEEQHRSTEVAESATPERLSVRPAKKPQKKRPDEQRTQEVSIANERHAADVERSRAKEPTTTHEEAVSKLEDTSVMTCADVIAFYKRVMGESIEQKRQLSAEEFEYMRQMFERLVDGTERAEQNTRDFLRAKVQEAEEVDELAVQLSAECEQIWQQFVKEHEQRAERVYNDALAYKELMARQRPANMQAMSLEQKQREIHEKQAELRVEEQRNAVLSNRAQSVNAELAQKQDEAARAQASALQRSVGDLGQLESQQYEQLKRKISEIYPEIQYLRQQLEEVIKTAE